MCTLPGAEVWSKTAHSWRPPRAPPCVRSSVLWASSLPGSLLIQGLPPFPGSLPQGSAALLPPLGGQDRQRRAARWTAVWLCKRNDVTPDRSRSRGHSKTDGEGQWIAFGVEEGTKAHVRQASGPAAIGNTLCRVPHPHTLHQARHHRVLGCGALPRSSGPGPVTTASEQVLRREGVSDQACLCSQARGQALCSQARG